MQCPMCGSETPTVASSLSADYHRCPNCGVLGLQPLPTPVAADAWYDSGYFASADKGGYVDYLGDEPTHRRNARRHLRKLGKGRNSPGRLIEIGAAAGFLLDEARSRGWTPDGVDVSAPMRDVARERFGLHMGSRLEELGIPPGSVDAVAAIQVIEHTIDPLHLLEEARRLMKPGARLLVETWDIGSPVARLAGRHWQQINPPSVVWIWNRRQLRLLLQRAGFHGIRMRTGFKWVTLRTVLGQLGQKQLAGLPGTGIPLPYPLGDLIVVTAIA